MSTNDKHDWVLHARALLEADSRATDAGTRARLARARARALSEARAPAGALRGRQLLAAAAVLSGVAVIALQLAPSEPEAPGAIAPEMRAAEAPPMAPAQRVVATADYALLAEVEDTALLDELEFYTWLAESRGEDEGEQDG